MFSDRDGTQREVGPANLREALRGRAGRSMYLALLVGLTLVAFWAPLSMLIRFSLLQEQYSHRRSVLPVWAKTLRHGERE